MVYKTDIKTLAKIEPKQWVEGKFWGDNPHLSKYFFMPNGYGLRRGENYYQNSWVLWNQANFGITNNFSVGVGMVPLFLFSAGVTPIWIAPKVSIPVVKNKFNIGAGVLVSTVIGKNTSGMAGAFYGVATYGSCDKNLTLGLGYVFSKDEVMGKTPIVSLSGMLRVTPHTYLLSENYILSFDETVGFASFGGRTFTKRVGIDYGLFLPLFPDMEGFAAIPWLGIAVPFGKVK